MVITLTSKMRQQCETYTASQNCSNPCNSSRSPCSTVQPRLPRRLLRLRPRIKTCNTLPSPPTSNMIHPIFQPQLTPHRSLSVFHPLYPQKSSSSPPTSTSRWVRNTALPYDSRHKLPTRGATYVCVDRVERMEGWAARTRNSGRAMASSVIWIMRLVRAR